MRNWSDVVPQEVADRQAKFERCRKIARMYEAGLNFRQIGERIGITGGRVRQLFVHYERVMQSPFGTPVESYLSGRVAGDYVEPRLSAPAWRNLASQQLASLNNATFTISVHDAPPAAIASHYFRRNHEDIHD